MRRFTPVMTLAALCWAVFLFNNLLWGGHLNQYGIVPRHLAGLPGILWAPLLHGSLEHLAANTVPLVVLGSILCARSRPEFMWVTTAGIVVSGGLTWLFGRNASHIGASGLVFCLFGYLTSMAYFRRTFGALLLSAACLLGYGGMLKGILPTSTAVSWEGHAAGLLTGIVLAWMTAKLTQPEPASAIQVPEIGKNIDPFH